MTKIVVQVLDIISLKNQYVCKLAKPEFGVNLWTYADDATLAWKFDSLHEADQCLKENFPKRNHHVYFFEVNG
jgi:hypothetical protein